MTKDEIKLKAQYYQRMEYLLVFVLFGAYTLMMFVVSHYVPKIIIAQ